MKNVCRLFLLLVIVSSSFISKAQYFDRSRLIEAEKKAAMFRFHNGSGSSSVRDITEYNLVYHRCNWTIDPSDDYISGSVTSYVIPNQDLGTLEFNLTLNLTVDSVLYHNQSMPFSQISGDLLDVVFSSLLSALVLDSVTVYYHGTPPSTGFGSFNQSTHGNNKPIVWTLSEPYGASDWFPCKNSLVDKIDSLDVFVTVPQGNIGVSNGLLVSQDQNGDKVTYHWKHRYPIATYLVCLAVTNYTTYNDYVPFQSDTLLMQNFVFPEDLSSAQSGTAALIPVMQLYDSLFELYPFHEEKYGHCEFLWGGGMEHQTITFVISFDLFLLAHELGHQWFGDDVTCGSWQDIWLNEGFATYCEGLVNEYLYGEGDFKQWRKNEVQYITSWPDGSVFVDDTTDINRIFDSRLTYDKGGMVLHMLRWVVGDSLFFQGLRNYLQDVNLDYGFARTSDLQAHLENVSGMDLTEFFDDWYYGQGYPQYEVTWQQNDTNLLYVTIDQTTSDPSVSFYKMPVPIRFSDATHDTILVFNNQFSGQLFTAPISFTATSAKVDPDKQIVSSENDIALHVPTVPDEKETFQLFPNPVFNLLQIHFVDGSTAEKNIRIINSLGQTVINMKWSGDCSINVQDLSAGVYELMVEDGKETYSKKFVKEQF